MANVTASFKDGILLMAISGQFTFDLHKEFSAAYKGVFSKESGGKPRGIEVDMRNVDYIDSAALGMLLSLRKSVGDEVAVRLVSAKPSVLNILKIANFDKKFRIE